MTPAGNAGVQSLRSCLESVSVRRGDERIEPVELCRLCDLLVAGLRGCEGCRVALTSQSPEHILAALAAAEAVGCQVLLLRSAAVEAPLLEAWRVSAVIDSLLEITHAGRRSVEDPGFRILIATSGTTGEPKLAEHSIKGLLGRIRRPSGTETRARWLLTYHPATFGGLQVLLTALSTGSEIVTVSPPAIPALSDAALAYRPTHVSATPTFWRSFLLYLGPRAKELDLKQVTLGGEIADEAILARLRATFENARVIHIYASTEAGALFSVQDGRPGFPAQWLETGIDGVELRIEDGVLQVRSPRAMKRYINKDTRTVMTPDGWLITGDLVERAEDRVLFRGREDCMLNVGGAKVRPEEVEAALAAMPEVVEASVYGAPNPITGMVVAADIVLRPGTGESEARRSILARMRENMDAYKVPRILRFVETIRMSAAGKKERRG